MISDRHLLIALYAVALAFLALVVLGGDDGMARCQTTHSFDVCHDALY